MPKTSYLHIQLLIPPINAVLSNGKGIRYGRTLAMSGDYAVIGASHVEDSIGEAYIYRLETHNETRGNTPRRTTRWTLCQNLRSPVGHGGYFGISVDIFHERIIVGASGFDPDIAGLWSANYEFSYGLLNANTGAAYIYALSVQQDRWAPITQLQPTQEASNGSYFGFSVGLWNNTGT